MQNHELRQAGRDNGMSESVIKTLLHALENNQDDVGVRLHVAGLLFAAEDCDQALRHFELVLGKDPANLAALRGAADCAGKLGDFGKSHGYQRLLTALGSMPAGDKVTPLFSDARHGAAAESSREKLSIVRQDAQDNVTVGPWDDFEPPITLADVGGMEAVKKRLNMAFLAPLKNPEMMKLYGKSLKGGLMLYGPPGCGKTFVARALAGELGATFMSVGLSDVLDMYFGESERKLHEIFQTARRKAPAVLFFDEVDAIGQKRSELRNSVGRSLVNQLLSEMDSIGSDNKNLFILAASNHPWDVDVALRRPGRLDRLVLVLPPDLEARISILEYHLRERPVTGLNLDQIAERTDQFSGADLAHLCETAIEHAMHDSIQSGHVRAVNMSDFQKAMRDVRPSTRPWFEMAKNYALFANEGGVYDELLDYVKSRKI